MPHVRAASSEARTREAKQAQEAAEQAQREADQASQHPPGHATDDAMRAGISGPHGAIHNLYPPVTLLITARGYGETSSTWRETLESPALLISLEFAIEGRRSNGQLACCRLAVAMVTLEGLDNGCLFDLCQGGVGR